MPLTLTFAGWRLWFVSGRFWKDVTGRRCPGRCGCLACPGCGLALGSWLWGCRCGVVALGLSLWGGLCGVVVVGWSLWGGRPGDCACRRCGLSPRVRGILRLGFGRVQAKRSIPACAGDPARAELGRCFESVYPRVCGGTLYTSAQALQWAGLSPRVRGILMIPAYRAPCGRSIPACAGDPR